MKKVLIYGDSNVWGDNFLTGVRIPDEKQWPNILQKKIGSNFKILAEGLPGRLAGDSEKIKVYKNGCLSFPSVFRTCGPVDILIIALGTNDLQLKYNCSASEIVDSLIWYESDLKKIYEDLDDRKKYFVNEKMPNIIYLLPPSFDYLGGAFGIFDKNSDIERKNIKNIFCKKSKNKFIDLGDIPLEKDGIHFNYEGHEKVADLVLELLKNE